MQTGNFGDLAFLHVTHWIPKKLTFHKNLQNTIHFNYHLKTNTTNTALSINIKTVFFNNRFVKGSDINSCSLLLSRTSVGSSDRHNLVKSVFTYSISIEKLISAVCRHNV